MQENKNNSFAYFKTAHDVTDKVENIMSSEAERSGQGDPFWTAAVSSLLKALFLYVWKKEPEQNRSYTTVDKYLDKVLNKNGGESETDILFNAWKNENPEETAVLCYDVFHLIPQKTAMAVVMCARTLLVPYVAGEIGL